MNNFWRGVCWLISYYIPSELGCVAYPHERLILQQFITKGNHPFQSKWHDFLWGRKRKVPSGLPLVQYPFPATWASGSSTAPLVLCCLSQGEERLLIVYQSLLLPADNYSEASNQSQGVITSGLVNVTSAANNTCTQTCQTGLTTFPDVNLITSSPLQYSLCCPGNGQIW